MIAASVSRFAPDDPLDGLEVGERPAPEARDGWSVVAVRAAALNHHDLWSLRGVGLRAEQLPMILGTDAAGVTADGREVVVHGVVGGPHGRGVPADEPRSLLSERYPGTLAEQVAVPTWNLVDKPAELSFVEAACLPTAWLTAYRMLFTTGRAQPGQRVLVQGAGGGLATAAVVLGAAAGLEVVVTSRDAAKRERALGLGAAAAVETGARVPRVDLVLESVGRATWSHSVRSVRPGGTIVVAGATSGDAQAAELQRIFFQEIAVLGTTMGTRDDLEHLLAFLARTGVRPLVDSVHPLADARTALARLAGGEQFGKIVLEV
ncbi:zinc-binding dehydrogenase [Cellulomonas fimi]|uniref:Alcohol dehydrogenase zinc-binding domain protein n=1 Tax=Cellulomonas fimi (strain ATCC 484 / DSM 20113 / JCM 1341 / CCUG 24087 / LMG 16345 / NBRC 15513 / NCIMB 8980 / NCTC 7547 / NRS-133) TaxID=590998 RepID=F4GY21_CELFA|nr:zinc-binding dehydrogenase [Cellulomonas fimi]AEE44689.1 Alcohol dehydrogenase zinc-binding domain protein [Cellulomonas fimi ATCC 484]NNH07499.1 zinc-binding dehydrogenase [Cellulomonas fimi]VEH27016.1 Alcohol dehydrogenase [Cellulomonas fimi]